MKKILITLFLLLTSFTFAQNTSVTGQITDAGGQAWNNGTFTFTFVGPQNVIWTGGTLNPNAPITGSLSASGAIPATNIPDNNQITPASTQWTVKVCSATLPTTCFSTTLTITGAAQTVNLTPGAIKFLVPTVPSNISPISAYADVEITGGWVGFQYYNLVSTSIRFCTTVTLLSCSAWGSSSGSGTVSPNSGSVGAIGSYAAAGGSTTIGPDILLTDNGTTLTYTGTGGIGSPIFKQSTNSAGGFASSAGTGTIQWASNNVLAFNTASTPNALRLDNSLGLTLAVGTFSFPLIASGTNCQLGGATGTVSPAACVAAPTGSIALPASITTYTVNTTAVTANSHIFIQQITDNSGISTATCNAGATTPIQSTRTAATSFTFTLTSVASVTCIQYWVIN